MDGDTLNKRLIIAILSLLVLFGGGFLVYTQIFEDKPSTAEGKAKPPAKAQPAAKRPAEKAAAPKYEVTAVDGEVEKRSGEGEWIPVKQGDQLPDADSLRTQGASKATVRLGDTAELTIDADSAVALKGEDETAQVELVSGNARVDFKESGRPVRMGFRGSDAIAEGSEGAFAATTSGDGDVAVASEKGSVKLTAAGQTVDIATGQVSTVAPDSAPSVPQAMPTSLLLKVKRPPSVTRKKTTTIAGTASPGSLVSVKGVTGRAGPDGTFALEVPLEEGKNDFKVVVRDVLGRKKDEALPTVKLDTKPPKAKSDVDW